MGRIEINGKPISCFDLQSLRSRIGYVHQEPKPHLTRALEACLLTGWVAGLPHGLQTSIQEAGAGVSGGEKQRIAIARAVLKKTDILFLDEITSALDPKTERQVIINLLNLPWRPGIICVTHRASLTRLFDDVIEIT